jgi:hypothetical protein
VTSWRKILSWEVAPDSIPFAEFSERVKPGDIWKFRNKEAGFEFYGWFRKINMADFQYVGYEGKTDQSLDFIRRFDGYGGSCSLSSSGVVVLEYVEDKPVFPTALASLRWEVSREGLDEAPRKGARVKMSEGVGVGDRSYAGFIVQPGDIGVITDASPDSTKPRLIEVWWYNYPTSGYAHGRASGWYTFLDYIEYI